MMPCQIVITDNLLKIYVLRKHTSCRAIYGTQLMNLI